jgi:hypothetical protein
MAMSISGREGRVDIFTLVQFRVKRKTAEEGTHASCGGLTFREART